MEDFEATVFEVLLVVPECFEDADLFRELVVVGETFAFNGGALVGLDLGLVADPLELAEGELEGVEVGRFGKENLGAGDALDEGVV